MEEISLKEIIETLLKGWKWIAVAVVVFTAAALSYGLIQPKLYASEVALKVGVIDINPTVNNEVGKEYLIGNLTSVAKFPVMDINSYTQQLVSDPVLTHTAEALSLTGRDGTLLSPEQLKNRLTVTADEKTNIIYVTVRDKNAQAAADLANMLAEQLRACLAETVSQVCADTAEDISRQMTAQTEQINIVTEQLKQYSDRPNNARVLERAIESQIEQISQYRADLNDVERGLQADALALNMLQKAMDTDGAGVVRAAGGSGTTPSGVSASQFKINIPSSDSRSRYSFPSNGEPALSVENSVPMEITMESDSDIENIVLTIKKAELEARLVQNEAEYQALQTSLAIMESKLSEMTGTLAEEKQKYDVLQRDYRLAGDIYAQYQNVHRQIAVIASSNLVRRNIQILSGAGAATSPENKSALFYAAIGGVLGVFLGMFAVLFKQYWAIASGGISNKKA